MEQIGVQFPRVLAQLRHVTPISTSSVPDTITWTKGRKVYTVILIASGHPFSPSMQAMLLARLSDLQCLGNRVA